MSRASMSGSSRMSDKASANRFLTVTRHTLDMSGSDLTALTHQTRSAIPWNQIVEDQEQGRKQWTWLQDAGNFSIHSKQKSESSGSYGVLAVGVVKGSVTEISSLLVSSSQVEYEQKMSALFDKTFKHGTYIGEVDEPISEANNGEAAQISLCKATFAKSGWLHRDMEWCFMESSTFDKEQHFEKLMTTLDAEDLMLDNRTSASFRKTRQLQDIICGYRVSPEPPKPSDVNTSKCRVAESRVHFYTEQTIASERPSLFPGNPFSSDKASAKATKQRMLQLAESCDRLTALVRRRRLGVQVLTDQRRFLPPTNTKCVGCEKYQLVAKLCRICGQGVCGSCSDVYDRETVVFVKGAKARSRKNGTIRVESVRVCDPCMARVETADYDQLSDNALFGATVYPDRMTSSSDGYGARTAEKDLKQLLRDSLAAASSQQRKSAVMSVIRCVLDQEKGQTTPLTPAPMIAKLELPVDPATLSPVGSEEEYISALDYLNVKNIPFADIEVSDVEGRAYPMNPKADLDVPMAFPVPDNEQQRLDEIMDVGIIESGTSDELNIICDLAAKEMGAFATIVTIITRDQQHVVAANVPELENMRMKREDSFCQHTIMDTKPLIVPHPEADVRFSRIMPVTGMGLRYYCGFPLLAGDGNTVIGTLCCVDQTSHEITESQFTALERLAKTASKVVKIQGDKRRASRARMASTVGVSASLPVKEMPSMRGSV